MGEAGYSGLSQERLFVFPWREDEQPDHEAFRAQARRYGFPEDAYLLALEGVQRLSRQAVQSGMDFLVKLAQALSKLGYANVELARALRQGEALADSLRETDRRKNEFMAMLSHELRNPLAPVRNSLYVLQRAAPGSEQARRSLEIIDHQTAHLARLVDDLLEVTRVVHGKVQLRRGPVVLDELVRGVADDHRAAFEARRVELVVELPEEPLRVEGDRTRLAQVLGNLLQNATKFTEQGRVTVALAKDEQGQRAVIRVRDTGAGIAPDVLPRLFQPFVQADTSLERAGGCWAWGWPWLGRWWSCTRARSLRAARARARARSSSSASPSRATRAARSSSSTASRAAGAASW